MQILKMITMGLMTIPVIAFTPEKKQNESKDAFKWQTEQFGDSRILRYKVPGFTHLTLKQKELVYYLGQAALAGRDITYDQNYKNNLLVRKTLEAIFTGYKGDRGTKDFAEFTVYLKKVWFCNGIHHHYSTDKFFPEFSKEYFATLVKGIKKQMLPLKGSETVEQFVTRFTPILYDPTVAPKRVNQDPGIDLVTQSASNFYNGVTQKEVEAFYDAQKEDAIRNHKDTLVAFGLNSTVVKENGKIVEKTWKVGGMYSPAIEKIVFWLNKALVVAENPVQKTAISKLIAFYKTGDLKTWDDYNVAWVKDVNSMTDFVNGFIEVYGDPMAIKGTWEAVVNFKDLEATKRTIIISDNAQYFEDNSPIDPRFRKEKVKGVTAKVITVTQLGGECHPTTPIGINLPNSQWIRKDFGSKSVTMDNITYSYDQSSLGNGFLEEFASSKEEISQVKQYGYLAGNLMTDLHECLGHGSGILNPGVTGESLKNYHSTIEESRADLFALYYLMDQKMIDLGLIPSFDVAKAEYDGYIRNGLMTQLVRVKPGKNIEEAHMRDRALICNWVYEKGKSGKVIEEINKDGKTYFRINDYEGLRKLFGQLLKEIQRITSEGDYASAKTMVETY
ncbi:MAG TPA: hypothetical protein VLR52_03885, partial [Bacteroidales bacterium]|nr:hypothetical protein [Bacteroidales bacterium]